MSAIVKSNFAQIRRVAIALLLMQPFVMGSSAFAQSIAPTQGVGSLGTQVTPDANNAQQLNITGGTQATANLYHSFQQFGLTQGEIANFMSNPSIQNILARVSGGNASVINGLIQVTGGNSSLYLLNPAGIIFGANSSLNVPAAFTATTANGIQVGNGWFGVNTGIDDVKKLTGTPQAFGFASSTSIVASEQPVAAIANAGNLTAKEGQSITLVGGLVINTGTITTPSGKITIAAVPDGKYIKITPEGSLLSLQLPIADQNQLVQSNVQAKDLPNLLTGSATLRNMTGLNVDTSGNVLVAGTAIPNTTGTAIASGNLNVSSNTSKGGEINVLGDRVALISANINASGAISGGTVLIGGDYLGKGIVPNAQYTFVSKDSSILADALQSGNGGKVIAWSNRSTGYLGNISAKGGEVSGNGGFVEVSGKENLLFQGKVNTTALNGIAGTILLDPNNITISSNASTVAFAPPVLFSDFTGTDINIRDFDLRGVAGNVVLQANNNITIDNTTVFNSTLATSITFQAGNDININVPNFGFDFNNGNTQTLSFIAGRDINVDTSAIDTDGFSSSFLFDTTASPTITLTAQNRNVNITGNFLVRNSPGEAGVTLNLNAPNGGVIVNNGFLRTGQVSMTTDSIINITAGQFRVTGTPINGAPTFNGAVQNTRYSLYTFSANANVNSQGNVSLQFGNDVPIISGNGGNNLINIRLLNDTNFVVGRTPTTSGVDGQIGIGVASIPPQVLTLLSDQSFSSNSNVVANALNGGLNGEAIAIARTADLQANAGDVQECEPTGTKKPLLTITASLPSVPTRAAQSSTASKLPPCKE
jgi:filamentous hemagglutinin family protein